MRRKISCLPVSFPYGARRTQAEIQYIFAFASPSGLGLNFPQTPLNANQRQLSDRMVGYWTEFAGGAATPTATARRTGRAFNRDRQVMQSFVPPTPRDGE